MWPNKCYIEFILPKLNMIFEVTQSQNHFSQMYNHGTITSHFRGGKEKKIVI